MLRLILILSLLSLPALAQVPRPTLLSLKGYGGDGDDQVLTNVTKTSDGGFIITLNTNSTYGTGNIDSFCSFSSSSSNDTGIDIFLKYNSDATILEWSLCSSNGIYLFPVANSNFVIGGISHFLTSGEWAFKILKQNDTGGIIWYKNYGAYADAILRDMIATNDGGYIMFGETNYSDTNFTVHYGSFMNADFAVMKVDSNGNKVWSKVIGGTGYESAEKVLNAPHGGCYIFGTTTSNDYDCTGNHGGSDAYIARLDSLGHLLWHRDLGGSGNDGGGSSYGGYACYDGKGDILFTTVSNSTDGDVSHQINPSGSNIWLIDIDSSNSIVWNNCYGGAGDEEPNSICKSYDGSIWMAGTIGYKGGEVDTAYGGGDAWFVHADSVGNFINAKVMGGTRQDEGLMIYPLSNGNIIGGGIYTNNDGVFSSLQPFGIDLRVHAFLLTFSPTNTGITNITEKNSAIKIYPNPTTNEFSIETNQNENIDVSITDIIGKIITNFNFTNKINISVSNWHKGIYSIQTIDEFGKIETHKLIIQY